ncbi:MAG TPA: oligopeptide/dipeptide ABC transporter ATP-binding protein [Solirubrobacteraceae bacterium]|nr:oligopeptide/dipeptide ABC transporter ATP-binding protein [Solirubrobacteraceae bacterium]
MSAGGTPVIEVRNLVRRFPVAQGLLRRPLGTLAAVDDVSFDVISGETLGIVGEHGAGKSTTARLLARLLAPTSGEIRFQGRNIAAARGAELGQLRRDVQMIFADPTSCLNPHRPVGASIGEPYAIHALHSGPGERRRRVEGLMQRVGLDPAHHDRYPHEFSSAERQRAGIARAIALEPKVLIADEPVAALDPSLQTQVLNLLRELQRERGLTLVFLTTDLAVASQVCDRLAVMYLGKVLELAPNEALVVFPRHPYTGVLLSAVAGAPRKRELITGEMPGRGHVPSGCRFHPRCPKAELMCSGHEPPLVDKGGGTVAACHYPLTAEESDSRLAAGAVEGTP